MLAGGLPEIWMLTHFLYWLIWEGADLRTVIMHRARPIHNLRPEFSPFPLSFSGQKVTSSLDWGKTSGLVGY